MTIGFGGFSRQCHIAGFCLGKFSDADSVVQTVLPAAIQPNVLLHLAWGNINILAETLTYMGSHLWVYGISTQSYSSKQLCSEETKADN